MSEILNVGGAALGGFALGAFCLIEPNSTRGYSVRPARWVRQGTLALLISGLVAGAQVLR